MLFHKRAKGKRLAPKKKDTEKEKQKSNEGTLQFYKQQLVILRQLLQKIISYLNDHPAGITIVASGFLAVSTFIIKFVSYCYERGRVSYWSIDISAIQVFNNNILLEILFGATFLAFFLFISGLFFTILPTKSSLRPFSLVLIISLYASSIALYLYLFHIDLNRQTLWLPALNMLLAISFKCLLEATKPSSRSSFQLFIAIMLFLMPVMTTHSIHQSGLDAAAAQRTFPLLNDSQVVVYSTSTTYYTARYTIDGDTLIIDTSRQGSYSRAEREVEHRTFEHVVLQE